MLLGRNWVEAVAEEALNYAKKHRIHPDYFHCLRPCIIEPIEGEFITPDVHWDEEAVTVSNSAGTSTGRIFVSDELRKRSPNLLKWAEVYALARALLDNPCTPREDYVFSLRMQSKYSSLERYKLDGMKSAKGINEALLKYITNAVHYVAQKKGKCSFGDLKMWLRRNADGSETGIPDCDEVEFFTEDEKPYLKWNTANGNLGRMAVSSLEKTYFKIVKKSSGK